MRSPAKSLERLTAQVQQFWPLSRVVWDEVNFVIVPGEDEIKQWTSTTCLRMEFQDPCYCIDERGNHYLNSGNWKAVDCIALTKDYATSRDLIAQIRRKIERKKYA